MTSNVVPKVVSDRNTATAKRWQKFTFVEALTRGPCVESSSEHTQSPRTGQRAKIVKILITAEAIIQSKLVVD